MNKFILRVIDDMEYNALTMLDDNNGVVEFFVETDVSQIRLSTYWDIAKNEILGDIDDTEEGFYAQDIAHRMTELVKKAGNKIKLTDINESVLEVTF